jgi:transcriptional regulator GlxA family with amidase domain
VCEAAAALREEPDARISLVVDRLRDSKGSAAIRELAETSGVSDRHLERLCLDALGFPPKVLARIVRLQAAVRDIVSRPAGNLTQNLADTAAATGYADQAHLRRDFVALAQLAPSGYLRLIRDYRFTLGQPMSDSF